MTGPRADAGGEAPLAEDFLVRMNERLGSLADGEYRDDVEDRPVIVVVGPPRSGTTLAVQLIASCLDVGFIDNLAAAFWRAPAYGIRLSRMLNPRPFRSTFQSSFGRTSGPAEPHEFGYFWNHLLRLPPLTEPSPDERAAVDWGRLSRVVLNVAATFEAPWLLKGFHLTWVLEDFTRALPSSIVVRMHRDELDTARSILTLRQHAFGDVRHWASLRPAGHRSMSSLTPEEQAAAQVVLVERALATQLAALPEGRLVEASLERVREDPSWLVAEVGRRLAALGAPTATVSPAPARFPAPSPRPPAADEVPNEEGLRRAFDRLRAGRLPGNAGTAHG